MTSGSLLVIEMTTSQSPNEHRRARAPGLWRALRQGARAIRVLHDEQVYMWERFYLANRALVPQTGPLTWVPTLDGYRLTGSHLPAAANEAGGDRR